MRRPFYISLATVLLPGVAFASAASTFSQLVNQLVSYLNFGAVTLITLAIAIYFFGVSKNLFKINSGESRAGMSSYLFWGIVAIFMMVSIWGIVSLVQNTIFGGSSSSSAYTSQSL